MSRALQSSLAVQGSDCHPNGREGLCVCVRKEHSQRGVVVRGRGTRSAGWWLERSAGGVAYSAGSPPSTRVLLLCDN